MAPPLEDLLFSWEDTCKLVANAAGEKYTGWYEKAREHERRERLWGMEKHMM